MEFSVLILTLLVSGFLGIYLILVKGKYILSPATLFIYYSMFYPIGLYLAQGSYMGDMYLFLLNRSDILFSVFVSSLLGIWSFLFFYLVKDRKIFFESEYIVRRILVYPFFIFLFILLVMLGHDYGWHAISLSKETNLYTTLYAYVKYLFIVLSLFMLLNRNLKNKELILIFILNVIVMFVDGARTTFLGLLLGYLFILYKKGVRFSLKTSFLIILGVMLLPAARAIVMSSDNFLSDFISSIVIESTFGGYTSLQGVYATQNSNYLFGLSYLLDPIIYLLPKDFRENHLFFNELMNINNLKGDEFAPLGGFYYIAETYSNFGVFGGAIVGGIFGYILRKLESTDKNLFIIALIFISTFGATFAKQNFANEFKIFFVFLIFSYFIRKIFVYKIKPNNI